MRRSTVILLVIFLLLAAVVWALQMPDNPIKKALATSTSSASGSLGSLINPAKGPANKISIRDAAGKTVTIDRTSGTWMIDTGRSVPMNQDIAESTSGQIFYLHILTRLEQVPDPAGTGLDKPAYIVSATLADQSNISFKIGKTTVTGSGYYVEAADRKTYIINKNDLDSLLNFFKDPQIYETPAPMATPKLAATVPGTPIDTLSQTPTPTTKP
jgi:hypothetical protein